MCGRGLSRAFGVEFRELMLKSLAGGSAFADHLPCTHDVIPIVADQFLRERIWPSQVLCQPPTRLYIRIERIPQQRVQATRQREPGLDGQSCTHDSDGAQRQMLARCSYTRTKIRGARQVNPAIVQQNRRATILNRYLRQPRAQVQRSFPGPSRSITQRLRSCRKSLPARSLRSQFRFHPLRIRHAARIRCSEVRKSVPCVQLDQHERLASDVASA